MSGILLYLSELIACQVDELERHICLCALRNTSVFHIYSLLNSYIEEMVPIVCTGVVAFCCEQFTLPH